MATDTKDDGRTVMLKGVPISFTDSLETASPTVEGGVPKHTTNVLVVTGSPNEKDNKAKIMSAMRAACMLEFGDDKADFFKVISEDNPMRVSYRKGERFKNSETQEVYSGYAGNMVIAGAGPGGSKKPKRPKLFDRRKRVLREQATPEQIAAGKTFEVKDISDIFYSGAICDVKVSFYCVSGKDKGGNGLFATLEAIRSHEEGERMAGGRAVQTNEDEFDDLEDDDDLDTGSTSVAAASDGDDDFG